MRLLTRLLLATGFASAMFLTSCSTAPVASSGGSYKVTALRPKNPDNVKVKLSTSTQHVYVMEGDRLLMAVQGTVGVNNTTPKGNFRITRKEKNKRRISQPDRGYPMAYWCEFKPAYGFHEGFVHARPRSHGCIRLHREAAARLFALVKVGTPVSIATTQPEDAKYGHLVRKLDQSRDPDPPRSLLMSPSWFKDPPGPLLVDG
jgi:lipoprotein-anchoring transpeptidase ErfK/SrfK